MTKIQLRKFPYPYRAILAISNDIDGMDLKTFIKVQKIMKDSNLEYADSFFMYSKENELSYRDLSGKEKNKKELKKYCGEGKLDTLHTFGNFSSYPYNEKYGLDSIKELNKEQIKIKVWTDHGNKNNTQNLQNKNVKKETVELIRNYGIKFIWDNNKKDSMEVGKDNIIFKKEIKGNYFWAFPGYTRIKKPLIVLKIIHLLNKLNLTKYQDFIRYPNNLKDQLSEKNLDKIIEKEQFCIVAQHFENMKKSDLIEGLKHLKTKQMDNKILVTTTAKLLEYNRVRKHIEYSVEEDKNITKININSINDPIFGKEITKLENIRGITFNNIEKNTEVYISDVKIPESEILRIDKTVGIKWL